METKKTMRRRFRRKAAIWVNLSFILPLLLAGALAPLLL
jgi:hypothetical protein